MCFLIFMLNQRPDYGRSLLEFLDNSINKPHEDTLGNYVKDCALTWKNFYEDFDHYYLVHWLDYFVITFLFRDPVICHFWQLWYEIIEISTEHRMPHFAECWWDHIIVDICLSNIPAIMCGMWCVDYFGLRRFDWLGRYGKASVWDWEIFHC